MQIAVCSNYCRYGPTRPRLGEVGTGKSLLTSAVRRDGPARPAPTRPPAAARLGEDLATSEEGSKRGVEGRGADWPARRRGEDFEGDEPGYFRGDELEEPKDNAVP